MTDDEHDAFCALSGTDRIRLLDIAVGEVGRRSPRPCGSDRCPPDCKPCRRATMARVAELMRGAPPLPVGAVLEVVPTRAEAEALSPAEVAERLRQRRAVDDVLAGLTREAS